MKRYSIFVWFKYIYDHFFNLALCRYVYSLYTGVEVSPYFVMHNFLQYDALGTR